MKLSTLKGTFRAIFDREILKAEAKQFGAIERERKFKAYDFLLALMTGACVGPWRSIAAVRRCWEKLTHETIDADGFEDHFNAGMAQLLWHQLEGLLGAGNRAMRRQWPAALRELRDILVADGTRMAVAAGLAEDLRGTADGQAALKLIGVYSLGKGHLSGLRASAAVHHDRKVLRLGHLVAGALYLLDLGFYDHDLFAEYVKANAFFVSRLKDNVMPTIEAVVEGVVGGRRVIGERLDGALTYRAEVDVDARFSVHDDPDTSTNVFRVVKLDVECTNRHGRPNGEWVSCWFVTNLPRESWTVPMIAALYRLRWTIERIWREAKHLARLDHLRSKRPTVLFIFVAASLVFHLLADRIIAQLVLQYGFAKVSRDGVLATLITAWPDLANELYATGEVGGRQLRDLSVILEHESRHPNPSQPRLIETVFKTLERETRRLAGQRV
jgi:putative transposase